MKTTHVQQPLRHTSVVIRHTLLEINFSKLILKFQNLLYDSTGFLKLGASYTVPISVDTFQESPLPKNLDSNTIRIQLFELPSLRTPSIRHVHFEPNGLDTAGCMWYSQT